MRPDRSLIRAFATYVLYRAVAVYLTFVLITESSTTTMKSLTIALATAKEAIRQPAFFVMAFFAGALLIVTIFVPYFTFGEDMKMYKDTGLTTISFFCMLLALLTASSTVADEIEGKTAITLLSKPINRRQFIVGKFLGIELGVLALYVLLGALFAAGVWYKYAYDLRESAGAAGRVGEAVGPGDAGHAGAGTRVFRSDRSDQHQRGDFDPVADAGQPCGLHPDFLPGPPEPRPGRAGRPESSSTSWWASWRRFFAWVLPSLEFFNAGPSISTGAVIPWFGYVLPVLGYCMLYSGAALLFAFLLFEDRDLA